jgi:hypothetical protein
MENTMGIFVLMAFYFALKALKLKEKVWFYIFMTALAIFLASFSKGLPGLFPIGIVGIWWLVKRTISFKQMVMYTLVLILIPAIIYLALIFLNENALESLSNYTFKRLFYRVQNAHTVGNRFHVLEKLIVETLPTLLLTVIFLVAGSFRIIKNKLHKEYNRDILFVFLVGLSGTIPLMLTLVQKSFYFIHALPFFALVLAMISTPVIANWVGQINLKNKFFKVFYVLTFIGLIGIIFYSYKQIGKTERDQEMLHDVHLIGNTVPAASLIGIDREMHNDWALHAYMVRYYNISFDPSDTNKHSYVLTKNTNPEFDTSTFVKLNLPLKLYSIYRARK